MRRAGSHSGWTPIPIGDRVAIGAVMTLGLAVLLVAAVAVTLAAGWVLLTLM